MARMFAGALVLLVLAGSSVEARIICHDEFQTVNGQEIWTPYCADNYLAEVAREYGYKVTNAAVRNSPSLKDKICRHIGNDIRISHNCDGDDSFDRRR